MIYHIAERERWRSTPPGGYYAPPSLDTEGFIHFSDAEQVIRVANRFYRGQPDLLLLAVDPGRLEAELRYEQPAPEVSERFPHLYGPLNLDAVTAVFDFTPAPDGTFHFSGSG
jgi:uncharacterized protein (DUF952 family)